MGGFLKLIIRYHFLLLFIFFESLALYFVINNNYDKKFKYLSSANAISGSFYEHYSDFLDYMDLREQNLEVSEKNALLLNQIERYAYLDSLRTDSLVIDTVVQYHYQQARVINQTVNKKYNYITLDKGANDSIKVDMGVVSAKGIVGIVRDVTDNYSLVISVLNPKLGISAKIKKNNYFGSLVWEGKDPQIAKLKEIPNHVEIAKGDTIITSGYSAIFPEKIRIGKIEDFERKSDGNFYDITVKLSTDFNSLTHVYIIDNELCKEQTELEETVDND